MSTYRSFAYTTPGVSHTKEKKAGQDFSNRRESRGLWAVAVADGHGEANCFRSDRGAKFAVECALRGMEDFSPPKEKWDTPKTREEMMGQLVKSVVGAWHEKVEQDYQDEGFTEEELAGCNEKHRKKFEAKEEREKAYGATLIAAAITPEYWFGFHIGDGRFTVLEEDGSFRQPVPWDEKCYLSVTTSICDYGANDRPRVHCELNAEKAPPVAIFLCSDGIDDNYPVEENEKYLADLYGKIAAAFAGDGFDSTEKQLRDLCDSFAQKGKGDDVSLAMLIDMDRIQQAVKNIKAAEKPAAPPLALVEEGIPALPEKHDASANPETGQEPMTSAHGKKKTGSDAASIRQAEKNRKKLKKAYGLKIMLLLVVAVGVIAAASQYTDLPKNLGEWLKGIITAQPHKQKDTPPEKTDNEKGTVTAGAAAADQNQPVVSVTSAENKIDDVTHPPEVSGDKEDEDAPQEVPGDKKNAGALQEAPNVIEQTNDSSGKGE